MPLYDYKCKCGFTSEVFVNKVKDVVSCEKCKKPMVRQFPTSFAVDSFPTDGLYLKNVSATGKTFHSKSEMISYANKNNLELSALL